LKNNRVGENNANKNCLATFILITPPYINAIDQEMQLYHDCSVEMNTGYIKLAKDHNIKAIDSGSWNIYGGITFDVDIDTICSYYWIIIYSIWTRLQNWPR